MTSTQTIIIFFSILAILSWILSIHWANKYFKLKTEMEKYLNKDVFKYLRKRE